MRLYEHSATVRANRVYAEKIRRTARAEQVGDRSKKCHPHFPYIPTGKNEPFVNTYNRNELSEKCAQAVQRSISC